MTTDEEYKLLLNILNFVYPKPHIVIIDSDTEYDWWFGVKLNRTYICSGFYRNHDIFFSHSKDDNREYLINKLIELNVGVIDNNYSEFATLIPYNDLKNLNI